MAVMESMFSKPGGVSGLLIITVTPKTLRSGHCKVLKFGHKDDFNSCLGLNGHIFIVLCISGKGSNEG